MDERGCLNTTCRLRRIVNTARPLHVASQEPPHAPDMAPPSIDVISAERPAGNHGVSQVCKVQHRLRV